MKKLCFVLSFVLLLCCAFEAEAQMDTQIDSRTPVWKRHKKYTVIGYEFQDVVMNGLNMKPDFAIAVSNGNTFYLHKKPIAGLMKFGLDWTHVDVSIAHFGEFNIKDGMEQMQLGHLKMDIGMGLGPSFTINPVDYLKLTAYFRVTPTYSLSFENSQLYGGYATFFNPGVHIAYKVISFGYEYRWCNDAKYIDLIAAFTEGEHNPARFLSTASHRVYIAFRVGGRKWK